MRVANLSNVLLVLDVTSTATGKPDQVFVQPHGRPKLDGFTVSPAARAQHAGKLVFIDEAPAVDPEPETNDQD